MRFPHKLENNASTGALLATLPKIYLIAVWARAGVRPYYFIGKYYKETGEPLVYDYDDKNGTEDAFYLRPITYVTTGDIIGWTQDEELAKHVADLYNGSHGLLV